MCDVGSLRYPTDSHTTDRPEERVDRVFVYLTGQTLVASIECKWYVKVFRDRLYRHPWIYVFTPERETSRAWNASWLKRDWKAMLRCFISIMDLSSGPRSARFLAIGLSAGELSRHVIELYGYVERAFADIGVAQGRRENMNPRTFPPREDARGIRFKM